MFTPVLAESPSHLRRLIKECMAARGPACDLNHIDVSQLAVFHQTFEGLDFTGDISRWNVSGGNAFTEMFMNCPFNGDISQWDVSNAAYMCSMFRKSVFNGDISRWDVGRVATAERMFLDCPFDGDLSQWSFSLDLDTHPFRGFVAHDNPMARTNLRLPPDLPAPVSDIFLAHKTMLHWLAASPMSRYHWDAVLFYPEYFPGKQGMPQEILDYAQVYRHLNPGAEGSLDPACSRSLQQSWETRLDNCSQLPLPCDLEHTA